VDLIGGVPGLNVWSARFWPACSNLAVTFFLSVRALWCEPSDSGDVVAKKSCYAGDMYWSTSNQCQNTLFQ